MLYLDKIEPKRSVRLSCTVGRRNPVHCTGVGKAVLAWLAEEEIDEIIHQRGLRRFTPKTLITPAELKADLKLTRERGYALDDEETRKGYVALPLWYGTIPGNRQQPLVPRLPPFACRWRKCPS